MDRELLTGKKPHNTSRAATGLLQRKDASDHERETYPPIVREILHSSGQPLDAQTRAFFEQRIGHNFSRVRVHTDSKAIESASSIGASAYTVNHHIVFGQSKYAPGTSSGRQLLKHELTHFIQQGRGHQVGPGETYSQRDHYAEIEARQESGSTHIQRAAPAGQIMADEESSSVWEYTKEFYGNHVKKMFSKEKKNGKMGEQEPDEVGKCAEPSEEIALHTREILDGASWASKRLAAASSKNSPEEAKKLEDLSEAFAKSSEAFAKGSELVKTSAEAFENLWKSVEFYEEVKKAKEAWDILKITDFRDPAASEHAAHAFDTLFTGVGNVAKIGSKYLPKGDWMFYAGLLSHFEDNGGFFVNIHPLLRAGFTAAEEGYQKSRLKDTAPPVEQRFAPPQESEPIKSLDEVSLDVESKINAVVSMDLPESLKAELQKALAKFSATNAELVRLVKETQPKYWGLIKPVVDEYKKEAIHKASHDTQLQIELLETTLKYPLDLGGDILLSPDKKIVSIYENF